MNGELTEQVRTGTRAMGQRTREPLRILHVVEAIGSGTGRHVLSILEHIDRSRFEIEVASPAVRNGEPDGEDFVREVRAIGLQWHCVAMKRSIDLRHDYLAFARLVQLARAGRFDVVHTHSSKAGFLGRAAARVAGTASVYTPNGLYFLRLPEGPRRQFYVLLERLAAIWGDRLIAVSNSEHDAAVAARLAPRRKLVTIENGIDSAAFVSDPHKRLHVRSELGIPTDAMVVGTVARFSVQKDPETLVRAFSVLRARTTRPLHLVWCGDGELRPDVDRLIDQLDLQNAVHLLGFRADARDVLQALDAFVLASRYEGLPYVLLEAMAAKVPVVATDVIGNRDVITDGETGLLVPPENPGALANALDQLLNDPIGAGHLATRAHRRVEERFSAGAMVRRLEALYEQVAFRT